MVQTHQRSMQNLIQLIVLGLTTKSRHTIKDIIVVYLMFALFFIVFFFEFSLVLLKVLFNYNLYLEDIFMLILNTENSRNIRPKNILNKKGVELESRVMGFFTHFLNTVNRKGIFLYIDLVTGTIKYSKAYQGDKLHIESNKFIKETLLLLKKDYLFNPTTENYPTIYVQSSAFNKSIIMDALRENILLKPYSMVENPVVIINNFKKIFKKHYNHHLSFEDNIVNINRSLKREKIFNLTKAYRINNSIIKTLTQKRLYSTVLKTIVSTHKKWKDFNCVGDSELNNDNICNTLDRLWDSEQQNFLNNKMMIQLRVRSKSGGIYSLSVLDTVTFDHLDTLKKIYINLVERKQEEYNPEDILGFFFYYCFVDKSFITKVENSDYSIAPSFKGWKKLIMDRLPKNMDYLSWGDVIDKKSDNQYSVSFIIPGKCNYIVSVIKDPLIKEITIKVTTRAIGGLYQVCEFSDSKIINNNIDFTRKSGNTTYSYSKGNIVNKIRDLDVQYIPLLKKPKLYPKNNIITMDIETREYKIINKLGEVEKIVEPVCISYKVDSTIKTFGIWDYTSPSEMVRACIKSLLKKEYNNYKIYIHNFSNFDAIFILKLLTKLEDTRVNFIKKDTNWISVTLHFGKINSNKIEELFKFKLIIYDSILSLPLSLNVLSKNFSVDSSLIKSKFPLKFLNEKNIDYNYEGEVPDINYFYKITASEWIDYKQMFINKKWNLKIELSKYCEQDVIALYNVITKFRELCFNKFNVNILKYPTISGISFAYFRNSFLKVNSIPILKDEHYLNIKKALFGGLNDVYLPYADKTSSLDFNGYYPSLMRNLPMPGGKLQFIEGDNILLEDLFGVAEVEVTIPEDWYMPTLPYKVLVKGSLKTIYPVGTFSGCYCTEELKYAKQKGAIIKVKSAYHFERINNMFTKFIDVLHNIRLTNAKENPISLVAKLLQNSSFGRFALSPLLDSHDIIDNNLIYDYQNKEHIAVKDFFPINDKQLCISYLDDRRDSHTLSSVVVSVFIAAYGRIEMAKTMLKDPKSIISVDTDGFKTTSDIFSDLIHSTELGKLKHENSFIKFYTIAPKASLGITADLNNVVKLKGLKDNSLLNPYHLIYLINNPDKNIVFKQEKWYRSITDENIVIKTQSYTFSPSENKREWIYDSTGKLHSTRPYLVKNGVIVKRDRMIIFYLDWPFYKPNFILCPTLPYVIYIYPLNLLLLQMPNISEG